MLQFLVRFFVSISRSFLCLFFTYVISPYSTLFSCFVCCRSFLHPPVSVCLLQGKSFFVLLIFNFLLPFFFSFVISEKWLKQQLKLLFVLHFIPQTRRGPSFFCPNFSSASSPSTSLWVVHFFVLTWINSSYCPFPGIFSLFWRKSLSSFIQFHFSFCFLLFPPVIYVPALFPSFHLPTFISLMPGSDVSVPRCPFVLVSYS